MTLNQNPQVHDLGIEWKRKTPTTNGKEPKDMKRIVLTIIFLAPLLAMAQGDFYERINKIRARRLLPKLQVDERLVLECKKWTIKLDGRVYHDPMTFRGEVLTNCPDPLECWMESKPHRKLLLKRKYRYVGYYVFNGVACARLK